MSREPAPPELPVEPNGGNNVLVRITGRSALSFPGTPDVLFGVSAFDAPSFLGATALLAAVALAASAGPLWRSTRVDPVIALRK